MTAMTTLSDPLDIPDYLKVENRNTAGNTNVSAAVPLKSLQTVALQCSGCGAEINAACNCGLDYVPVAQRVAEYDKENPGRSTRQAASDLDVSRETVRTTRAGDNHLSPDHVTGRDGKQYPARKMPAKKESKAKREAEEARHRRQVMFLAHKAEAAAFVAELRDRIGAENFA
jgi:hypothetical protein